MKSCLVRSDGFITDIVEKGEEFDVYTGPGSSLKWVDAPDEVDIEWRLMLGEWIPDFLYTDPLNEKLIAYGEPGAQIGKLWKDIDAGLFGENAKKGQFYTHIAEVKAKSKPITWKEIEVPDPMTGEMVKERVSDEPDQPFPHDDNMPAWNTAEEMDIGVRREFKLCEFADRGDVAEGADHVDAQPITSAPVTEAVDTNPDVVSGSDVPTSHAPDSDDRITTDVG